jgi:hypothetical protein
MADSTVAVTEGAGANIDTRTEATNGNHRQVIVIGDPSTNAGVAPVDASAGLKVDLGADNDVVASVPAGATNIAKAEDVASAGADVGVPAMAVQKATPADTAGTDGDYEFLQMKNGRLYTSPKLEANSGVDIGDVDVTSAIITGGATAHDAADAGNPIKIGAKASATPSDDTMVANGDRTDAISDLDGALLVRNGRTLGDILSERISNTDGASTASTVFGATASTRNVITGYSVYNASATAGYLDFRDGTAGSILWTVPLPATGGANFAIEGGIFRTTANTALAYDVSAALTTVYISVTGFKSKV